MLLCVCLCVCVRAYVTTACQPVTYNLTHTHRNHNTQNHTTKQPTHTSTTHKNTLPSLCRSSSYLKNKLQDPRIGNKPCCDTDQKLRHWLSWKCNAQSVGVCR